VTPSPEVDLVRAPASGKAVSPSAPVIANEAAPLIKFLRGFPPLNRVSIADLIWLSSAALTPFVLDQSVQESHCEIFFASDLRNVPGFAEDDRDRYLS